LSAVAQEERPLRDDHEDAEPDVAAEDDDTAESAGTRTTSRLALSFLRKAGDTASAEAKLENGQLATTTVSLSGQKTAAVAAAGGQTHPSAGAAETLGGLGGLVEADGTLTDPAMATDSAITAGLDALTVSGGKKSAVAGAMSDMSTETLPASDLDALVKNAGKLGADDKTGKVASGDRKTPGIGESNVTKQSAVDADAEAGQTAAADAGQIVSETSTATDSDLQTSAQAVATLLGGLMAAEGPQSQVKTTARSDAASSKSDKENAVLANSAALEDGVLLDAALAEDALNKTILEKSVAADETEKRSFRLVSAQGGRSLDMTIGTDQNGKATVDTSTKTSGAETVTVLDSRRFLGFTQSTNGAALTSTISGDAEWQRAMQSGATLQNEQARSGTSNVVNTLKLQMTPIDLGTVTATLRLVGEELSVHLTVETRAAHQQLSDDSSGILGALRAQGFSVDQVTVTMSSQDSNAQLSGNGQQPSADTNAQQGNSQSQGQSSGRSEASVKHGSNEIEAGPEARPHSTDSAGGTSDLYL
jgi:chemotaxis protein MotD